MTSNEVVEYLGIPKQSLSLYTKKGYISPIKKVGNSSLFFIQDVKNLEKIRDVNIETYQKPKKH